MISVALVGLGQIGFEYDLYLNNSIYNLTHFSALKNNHNYNIKFLIDLNIEEKIVNHKHFLDKKMQIFKSIDEIPNAVDMLVLAVPPNLIFGVLSKYLKLFNCKYIVGEKLGMMTDKNLKKIQGLTSNRNIEIFSNYYRRYLPETLIVKNKLKKQIIKVINCTFTNEPSETLPHIIDLISFLLECPPKLILRKDNLYLFKFDEIDCVFYNISNVDFDHYTLEIITDKNSIYYSMDDLPIVINKVTEDKLFNGRKILNETSFIKRNSRKSIKYLYENIYETIMGKSAPITTFQEDITNLRDLKKTLMRRN